MIVGEVVSVTLLESITSEIDYCEICIDFDAHKIFGKYKDLLGYMNKRVTYDVIPDIYKGNRITTIVNLAEIYKVQALDKNRDIRLIPKESQVRPGCNFDSKALLFGDTKLGAVAYLSSIQKGSSDKSEWIDCTMVDMNSRVFVARQFTRGVDMPEGITVEASLAAKVGSYIEFDITSTKYGLQLSKVKKLDLPVMCPPEVETAIAIIMSIANEDKELMDYIQHYDFIDCLKQIIDVEPGYHLVRIASELSLINAVENVSNLYDFKLLKRAAITSRGYLLPANIKYSRPLLNVTKLIKTPLKTDNELLLILDPASEEKVSPSKNVFMKMAQFSESLLMERRGLSEEVSDIIDFKHLRNVTGGLF